MILLKYTKTDGAEFVGHIDIIRHIGRTLTRAKIGVEYSQGFNPHRRINLSSPLPLGLKSEGEYCVIDTNEEISSFKEKFNAFSPRGIKCVDCKVIDKKVNVADLIDGALYKISGIEPFDTEEFLSVKERIITDKRGKQINIPDRVKMLKFEGNELIALLNFGRNNLRIDDFLKALNAENAEAVKIESYIGNKSAKEVLFG